MNHVILTNISELASRTPEWVHTIIIIITAIGGKELISAILKNKKEFKVKEQESELLSKQKVLEAYIDQAKADHERVSEMHKQITILMTQVEDYRKEVKDLREKLSIKERENEDLRQQLILHQKK